jgi:antitoxin component YwqK of YwqJK toxin-antitoxin module
MKRVLWFASVVGVVLVLNWFSGESSDGPIEEYHDNGQLFMKGTVKDGELIVKGSYKDGEPCGEWIMLGETVTQELPC